MAGRIDVWQGTLSLMVLRTLEVLGPQHGYGSRVGSRRRAAGRSR